MTAKRFTVVALKWRDRVNGNTYHSARCIRHRDGAELACPFTYGYGDHYRQTALTAMTEAGWLGKAVKGDGLSFERLNGYPIIWTVADALKRECVAHGED